MDAVRRRLGVTLARHEDNDEVDEGDDPRDSEEGPARAQTALSYIHNGTFSENVMQIGGPAQVETTQHPLALFVSSCTECTHPTPPNADYDGNDRLTLEYTHEPGNCYNPYRERGD